MQRITEKCPDVEGDLLPGEGVWHFPYLSSGGIGRGRGRVGEEGRVQHRPQRTLLPVTSELLPRSCLTPPPRRRTL